MVITLKGLMCSGERSAMMDTYEICVGGTLEITDKILKGSSGSCVLMS